MSACCHYCAAEDRDLRPYGPGGALVCLPCMTSTPDREAAAEAAFGALLDAAEVLSPVGVAVVGQESGPQPFDPSAAPVVGEREERP